MSGTRLKFIENRVVTLCRGLKAEDDVTVKSIDPDADGWFDTEEHPVFPEARRDRFAAVRGLRNEVPFNELSRRLIWALSRWRRENQGFIPSTMQPVRQVGYHKRTRSLQGLKDRFVLLRVRA